METMLSENTEEKKQSLVEGTLFTASSPQIVWIPGQWERSGDGRDFLHIGDACVCIPAQPRTQGIG